MPESMKKDYDMVTDLMVKLKNAVPNPFFCLDHSLQQRSNTIVS